MGCDDLRGGEEVFGSIAEAARAESGFARLCQKAGGWEKMVGTTESLAEAGVDLADLDDLFERGADKIGEAFPGIFAEGSQSGVSFLGGGEGEVGGGESGEKRGPSEI